MKKYSNLKVVKGPSTKVGKGVSKQLLPNHYNLKSLRRLNKEYTKASKELLVAILEILAAKKIDEVESTLCRFIEGIGLGKSPLSYFLQILIDKPLLRFMAINQLQRLPYSSQLQILNVMGEHWSDDMHIINKLSHLAETTHASILTQEISPLNTTIPVEEILKRLVQNTEDMAELRAEVPLLNSDYLQIAAH